MTRIVWAGVVLGLVEQGRGGGLGDVVVKEVVDLKTLHVAEGLCTMLASDWLARFLEMQDLIKVC